MLSRQSRICKFMSVLVAAVFLLEQIGWTQDGKPVWQDISGAAVSRTQDPLKNIDIPHDIGQVDQSVLRSGADVIINIQDAHASFSAQLSIAGILDSLITDYDVNLIAVEGASEGYLDTSLLRTFPDKKIRDNTAEFLMREGRMSAGEFFSITRDREDVALYGVEDEELYKKDLESFCAVSEERAARVENAEKLLSQMELLTEKVYSPELRELERKSTLHRKGELSFAEYWSGIKDLAASKGITPKNSPNIEKLLRTMSIEKGIDFAKANEERKKLIDELSAKMDRKDIEALVLKSLAFKQNKISQGEFHSYLATLAETYGVSPDEYPDLITFTEYVTLYQKIDIVALHREFASLEEELRGALYRDNFERGLSEWTRLVRLLERLYTLELSTDDTAYIIAHRKDCDAVRLAAFIKDAAGKYQVPITGGYDLAEVFSGVDAALEFYRVAEERNGAMLANTLKRMRAEGKHVAALVTGGYHTQGLADLMKKGNLSYLVIVPKFEDGKERPYVAILTNKKKPYEQLLETGKYQLAVRAYFNDRDEDKLVAAVMYAMAGVVRTGGDWKYEAVKWQKLYAAEYERLRALSPENVRNSVFPSRLSEMLGIGKEDGQGELRVEKWKDGVLVLRMKDGNASYFLLDRGESGMLDSPRTLSPIQGNAILAALDRSRPKKEGIGGRVSDLETRMGKMEEDLAKVLGRAAAGKGGEELIRSLEEDMDLLVSVAVRTRGARGLDADRVVRALNARADIKIPQDWKNDPALSKAIGTFVTRVKRTDMQIEFLAHSLREDKRIYYGMGRTLLDKGCFDPADEDIEEALDRAVPSSILSHWREIPELREALEGFKKDIRAGIASGDLFDNTMKRDHWVFADGTMNLVDHMFSGMAKEKGVSVNSVIAELEGTPDSPKRTLEIGSGSGRPIYRYFIGGSLARASLWYRDGVKNNEVTSIDRGVTPDAANRLFRMDFLSMDLFAPGTFDDVFCANVLNEECYEMYKALNAKIWKEFFPGEPFNEAAFYRKVALELFRVMKPGGKVYMALGYEKNLKLEKAMRYAGFRKVFSAESPSNFKVFEKIDESMLTAEEAAEAVVEAAHAAALDINVSLKELFGLVGRLPAAGKVLSADGRDVLEEIISKAYALGERVKRSDYCGNLAISLQSTLSKGGPAAAFDIANAMTAVVLFAGLMRDRKDGKMDAKTYRLLMEGLYMARTIAEGLEKARPGNVIFREGLSDAKETYACVRDWGWSAMPPADVSEWMAYLYFVERFSFDGLGGVANNTALKSAFEDNIGYVSQFNQAVLKGEFKPAPGEEEMFSRAASFLTEMDATRMREVGEFARGRLFPETKLVIPGSASPIFRMLGVGAFLSLMSATAGAAETVNGAANAAYQAAGLFMGANTVVSVAVFLAIAVSLKYISAFIITKYQLRLGRMKTPAPYLTAALVFVFTFSVFNIAELNGANSMKDLLRTPIANVKQVMNSFTAEKPRARVGEGVEHAKISIKGIPAETMWAGPSVRMKLVSYSDLEKYVPAEGYKVFGIFNTAPQVDEKHTTLVGENGRELRSRNTVSTRAGGAFYVRYPSGAVRIVRNTDVNYAAFLLKYKYSVAVQAGPLLKEGGVIQKGLPDEATSRIYVGVNPSTNDTKIMHVGSGITGYSDVREVLEKHFDGYPDVMLFDAGQYDINTMGREGLPPASVKEKGKALYALVLESKPLAAVTGAEKIVEGAPVAQRTPPVMNRVPVAPVAAITADQAVDYFRRFVKGAFKNELVGKTFEYDGRAFEDRKNKFYNGIFANAEARARVQAVNRWVDANWKLIAPTLPKYITTTRAGAERDLAQQKALFILMAMSPELYKALEDKGAALWTGKVPGAGCTTGSRAGGMWGVPIIKVNSLYGNNYMGIAETMAHESVHARQMRGSFLSWWLDQSASLTFLDIVREMPSNELPAFGMQTGFMKEALNIVPEKGKEYLGDDIFYTIVYMNQKWFFIAENIFVHIMNLFAIGGLVMWLRYRAKMKRLGAEFAMAVREAGGRFGYMKEEDLVRAITAFSKKDMLRIPSIAGGEDLYERINTALDKERVSGTDKPDILAKLAARYIKEKEKAGRTGGAKLMAFPFPVAFMGDMSPAAVWSILAFFGIGGVVGGWMMAKHLMAKKKAEELRIMEEMRLFFSKKALQKSGLPYAAHLVSWIEGRHMELLPVMNDINKETLKNAIMAAITASREVRRDKEEIAAVVFAKIIQNAALEDGAGKKAPMDFPPAFRAPQKRPMPYAEPAWYKTPLWVAASGAAIVAVSSLAFSTDVTNAFAIVAAGISLLYSSAFAAWKYIVLAGVRTGRLTDKDRGAEEWTRPIMGMGDETLMALVPYGLNRRHTRRVLGVFDILWGLVTASEDAGEAAHYRAVLHKFMIAHAIGNSYGSPEMATLVAPMDESYGVLAENGIATPLEVDVLLRDSVFRDKKAALKKISETRFSEDPQANEKAVRWMTRMYVIFAIADSIEMGADYLRKVEVRRLRNEMPKKIEFMSDTFAFISSKPEVFGLRLEGYLAPAEIEAVKKAMTDPASPDHLALARFTAAAANPVTLPERIVAAPSGISASAEGLSTNDVVRERVSEMFSRLSLGLLGKRYDPALSTARVVLVDETSSPEDKKSLGSNYAVFDTDRNTLYIMGKLARAPDWALVPVLSHEVAHRITGRELFANLFALISLPKAFGIVRSMEYSPLDYRILASIDKNTQERYIQRHSLRNSRLAALLAGRMKRDGYGITDDDIALLRTVFLAHDSGGNIEARNPRRVDALRAFLRPLLAEKLGGDMGRVEEHLMVHNVPVFDDRFEEFTGLMGEIAANGDIDPSDAEWAVRFFYTTNSTLKNLSDARIDLSLEAQLLIRFHHSYFDFESYAKSALPQELPPAVAERIRKLLPIVRAVDIFENGQNSFKRYYWYNRAYEDLRQTFDYLERAWQNEEIIDRSVLASLRRLTGEGSKDLSDIIAEARESWHVEVQDDVVVEMSSEKERIRDMREGLWADQGEKYHAVMLFKMGLPEELRSRIVRYLETKGFDVERVGRVDGRIGMDTVLKRWGKNSGLEFSVKDMEKDGIDGTAAREALENNDGAKFYAWFEKSEKERPDLASVKAMRYSIEALNRGIEMVILRSRIPRQQLVKEFEAEEDFNPKEIETVPFQDIFKKAVVGPTDAFKAGKARPATVRGHLIAPALAPLGEMSELYELGKELVPESMIGLIANGVHCPKYEELPKEINDYLKGPAAVQVKVAAAKPAVIPSLKELVAPEMPLAEYAVRVAPWVEEALFFALPMVASSFMFGLGSFWTVAVMAGVRIDFLRRHPGARPHAPPAAYRTPLTVTFAGFVISLLPVVAAMSSSGLSTVDGGLTLLSLITASSVASALFHAWENSRALAAGRTPAAIVGREVRRFLLSHIWLVMGFAILVGISVASIVVAKIEENRPLDRVVLERYLPKILEDDFRASRISVKDQEKIDGYVMRFKSGDPDARSAAVEDMEKESLGVQETVSTIPELLRVWRTSDSGGRRSIEGAFGRIYREKLNVDVPDVPAAMSAMNGFLLESDRDGFPAFIAFVKAKAHEDKKVRELASAVLANSPVTAKEIPALLTLIDDKNYNVRVSASARLKSARDLSGVLLAALDKAYREKDREKIYLIERAMTKFDRETLLQWKRDRLYAEAPRLVRYLKWTGIGIVGFVILGIHVYVGAKVARDRSMTRAQKAVVLVFLPFIIPVSVILVTHLLVSEAYSLLPGMIRIRMSNGMARAKGNFKKWLLPVLLVSSLLAPTAIKQGSSPEKAVYQAQVSSLATIPSLKQWYERTFNRGVEIPLDRYAKRVAPWVEEALFFALPMVASSFMFGLGSFWTVAVMAGVRVDFLRRHPGARVHAPPSEYITPRRVALEGFLVSLLPGSLAMVFGLSLPIDPWSQALISIAFAFVSAGGHMLENFAAPRAGRTPAVLEPSRSGSPSDEEVRKALKMITIENLRERPDIDELIKAIRTLRRAALVPENVFEVLESLAGAYRWGGMSGMIEKRAVKELEVTLPKVLSRIPEHGDVVKGLKEAQGLLNSLRVDNNFSKALERELRRFMEQIGTSEKPLAAAAMLSGILGNGSLSSETISKADAILVQLVDKVNGLDSPETFLGLEDVLSSRGQSDGAQSRIYSKFIASAQALERRGLYNVIFPAMARVIKDVSISDITREKAKNDMAVFIQNVAKRGDPASGIPLLVQGLSHEAMDGRLKIETIKALAKLKRIPLPKRRTSELHSSIIGIINDALDDVFGHPKKGEERDEADISGTYGVLNLHFHPDKASDKMIDVFKKDLAGRFDKAFVKAAVISDKDDPLHVRVIVTPTTVNLTALWRMLGTQDFKTDAKGNYRKFTQDEIIEKVKIRANMLLAGIEAELSGMEMGPEHDALYEQYKSLWFYLYGDGTEVNPGIIHLIKYPDMMRRVQDYEVPRYAEGKGGLHEWKGRKLVKNDKGEKVASYGNSLLVRTETRERLGTPEAHMNWSSITDAEAIAESNPYFAATLERLSENGQLYKYEYPSGFIEPGMDTYIMNTPSSHPWDAGDFYKKAGKVGGIKRYVYLARSGGSIFNTSYITNLLRGGHASRHQMFFISRDTLGAYQNLRDMIHRQIMTPIIRDAQEDETEASFTDVTPRILNLINDLYENGDGKGYGDLSWKEVIDGIWRQLESSHGLETLKSGDHMMIVDEFGRGTYDFLFKYIVERKTFEKAKARYDMEVTEIKEDGSLSEKEKTDRIKALPSPEPIYVHIFIGHNLYVSEHDFKNYPVIYNDYLRRDFGVDFGSARKVEEAVSILADSSPHAIRVKTDVKPPVISEHVPIEFEDYDVLVNDYLANLYLVNGVINFYDSLAFDAVVTLMRTDEDSSVREAAAKEMANFDLSELETKAKKVLMGISGTETDKNVRDAAEYSYVTIMLKQLASAVETERDDHGICVSVRVTDVIDLLKNVDVVLEAVKSPYLQARLTAFLILDALDQDFSKYVLQVGDEVPIDELIATFLQQPKILAGVSADDSDLAVVMMAEKLKKEVEARNTDTERPVPIACFIGGQAVGKRYIAAKVDKKLKEELGDNVNVRHFSMEEGWGLDVSRREDETVFGKVALKDALGFRNFVHSMRKGEPAYCPFYDMRQARRFRVIDTIPYVSQDSSNRWICDEVRMTADIKDMAERLKSSGAREVRIKSAMLLQLFDEKGEWLIKDEGLRSSLEERFKTLAEYPYGWDRNIDRKNLYIDVTERKNGAFITGDIVEKIVPSRDDVILITSSIAGNDEVFLPQERARLFNIVAAVWAPLDMRKRMILQGFQDKFVYQYMDEDKILAGFEKRLPIEMTEILPSFRSADIIIKNTMGLPGTQTGSQAPATVPAIKKFLAPKMSFAGYAVIIAPVLEEAVFFAAPLIIGHFASGLESLWSVSIMVFFRIAFFYAHPAKVDILTLGADVILSLVRPEYRELRKHTMANWKYAYPIALRMGISPGSEEMEMLRVMTLAHDLGGILGYKPDERIESKLLALASHPKYDILPRMTGRSPSEMAAEFERVEKSLTAADRQEILAYLLRKGIESSQIELTNGEKAYIAHLDHPNQSLRMIKKAGIKISPEVEMLIGRHMDVPSEEEMASWTENVRRVFACFVISDVLECGNNHYKKRGGYFKHSSEFELPADTLDFLRGPRKFNGNRFMTPFIDEVEKLIQEGGLEEAFRYSRSPLIGGEFAASAVPRAPPASRLVPFAVAAFGCLLAAMPVAFAGVVQNPLLFMSSAAIMAVLFHMIANIIAVKYGARPATVDSGRYKTAVEPVIKLSETPFYKAWEGILRGAEPAFPELSREVRDKLRETRSGTDFLFNYNKIVPSLRYLFHDLDEKDRGVVMQFLRNFAFGQDMQNWTLADFEKLHGIRSLLRTLLVVVYNTGNVSPRIKRVVRGIAYGMGLLPLLMEHGVCLARLESSESGRDDLLEAVKPFAFASSSEIPDEEGYRSKMAEILPYHYIFEEKVRATISGKKLGKLEPEGSQMLAYSSDELPFVVKVLKPGGKNINGQPLVFERDILPGVNLARTRLGGLAANALVIKNLVVNVDGKEVVVEEALIQTKVVTIRQKMEDLAGRYARGDTLAKAEADRIIRKWWELQAEMWRRGVVDADIKLYDNYGYDEWTDSVVIFDYTNISANMRDFWNEDWYESITDVFRRANVSVLGSIGPPEMKLGEAYMSGEYDVFRRNDISIKGSGDEISVSVWPSPEEMKKEDMFVPLNDPFTVDSKELGRMMPALKNMLGEGAYGETEVSDDQLSSTLSTLVYNMLWFSADRQLGLAGETIHPTAGALRRSMADKGIERSIMPEREPGFPVTVSPGADIKQQMIAGIKYILGEEDAYRKFGLDRAKTREVTIEKAEYLVGRDLATLKIESKDGSSQRMGVVFYKNGYNLDASIEDPYKRVASRLLQLYRDYSLNDYVPVLRRAGLDPSVVTKGIEDVFREKFSSEDIYYRGEEGFDCYVFADADVKLAIKDMDPDDKFFGKDREHTLSNRERTVRGYTLARDNLGHIFIRFTMIPDLRMRIFSRMEKEVVDRTAVMSAIQKRVPVLMKREEGGYDRKVGGDRFSGILADAIEAGELDTAKRLIDEYLVSVRAMMTRGVFDWNAKTSNYGYDPSTGHVGSIDASRFKPCSEVTDADGQFLLEELESVRSNIRDWTFRTLDGLKSKELVAYLERRMSEVFSTSDFKFIISEDKTSSERDFARAIRGELSYGIGGVPVCYAGPEEMKDDVVKAIAEEVKASGVDVAQLERLFAEKGFRDAGAFYGRSEMLKEQYIPSERFYMDIGKGPYLGAAGKISGSGVYPVAREVLLSGRYGDSTLSKEEVEKLKKDIAKTLIRIYDHSQAVYDTLADKFGLDRGKSVIDKIDLEREFAKIMTDSLTDDQKRFLLTMFGITEIKNLKLQLSVAFDEIKEDKRYPFDISLNNFTVKRDRGGYSVEMESSGALIRKGREFEIVDHMHQYLLIPYPDIFEAIREEKGARAAAVFCERVFFQADEGTELKRSAMNMLKVLYSDKEKGSLGPWIEKQGIVAKADAEDGQALAVAVPAAVFNTLTPGQIQGLERTPGVRIVVVEDDTKEGMLRQLEEARSREGMLAGALVDFNVKGEDIVGLVTEFAGEVRGRIFVLAHPEVAKLTPETIGQIKALPELLREISDKYLDRVSSLEVNSLGIYQLRVSEGYKAFRGVEKRTEGMSKQDRVEFSPASLDSRGDHFLVHFADGEMVMDPKRREAVIPPGLEISRRREVMKVVKTSDMQHDKFMVVAPAGVVTEGEKDAFRKKLMSYWMLDGVVDVSDVIILERRPEGYETGELLAEMGRIDSRSKVANTGFRTIAGSLTYDDTAASANVLQVDLAPDAMNNFNQYEVFVNLLLSREAKGIPGLEMTGRGQLFIFLPQARAVDLEEEIRIYDRYVKEVLVRA